MTPKELYLAYCDALSVDCPSDITEKISSINPKMAHDLDTTEKTLNLLWQELNEKRITVEYWLHSGLKPWSDAWLRAIERVELTAIGVYPLKK